MLREDKKKSIKWFKIKKTPDLNLINEFSKSVVEMSRIYLSMNNRDWFYFMSKKRSRQRSRTRNHVVIRGKIESIDTYLTVVYFKD